MVISDRHNGRRRVQCAFITDDSSPLVMNIQSITVFQVVRMDEYTHYSDAYRFSFPLSVFLLSLFPLLSPLSHSSCPIRVYAYRPLLSFHSLHFPYSLSQVNSPLKSERPHMTRGGRSLYRYLFKLFLPFLRWLFTDPGSVHANRPPILDRACISTFLLNNGLNQLYLNHQYSKSLVALSLKPLLLPCDSSRSQSSLHFLIISSLAKEWRIRLFTLFFSLTCLSHER